MSVAAILLSMNMGAEGQHATTWNLPCFKAKLRICLQPLCDHEHKLPAPLKRPGRDSAGPAGTTWSAAPAATGQQQASSERGSNTHTCGFSGPSRAPGDLGARRPPSAAPHAAQQELSVPFWSGQLGESPTKAGTWEAAERVCTVAGGKLAPRPPPELLSPEAGPCGQGRCMHTQPRLALQTPGFNWPQPCTV